LFSDGLGSDRDNSGHLNPQIRVRQSRFDTGPRRRILFVHPGIVNRVHFVKVGDVRQKHIDGQVTRFGASGFGHNLIHQFQNLLSLNFNGRFAIRRDLTCNAQHPVADHAFGHPRAWFYAFRFHESLQIVLRVGVGIVLAAALVKPIIGKGAIAAGFSEFPVLTASKVGST